MTRADDAPRRGRPRRFDGDSEKRLLMDAAARAMTGAEFLEVAVADVLTEAGLSTRSFYRHFSSKEELLIALMRRDADSVGRALDRAVEAAPDPVSALTGWLDVYLDVFYQPTRAGLTTVYASPGARASPTVLAEVVELRKILMRSLIRALRDGHRQRALTSPSPARDAATIMALVGAAATPPDGHRTRRAARAQVLRFALPGLGLATDDRAGAPRVTAAAARTPAPGAAPSRAARGAPRRATPRPGPRSAGAS